MSRSERSVDVEGALEGLEGSVTRAVDRIRELEGRLRAAEARRREVEALLARMTSGEESPVDMQDRMRELEAQNGDFRRRLDEGREGIERLLTRIRFLEEQR